MVADTLSRAPVSTSCAEDDELRAELETFAYVVMQNLNRATTRGDPPISSRNGTSVCTAHATTATDTLNVVTIISTLLLYMNLVRMTYWTVKYLVHTYS